MRIAVCFSGQIRTGGKCFLNIKKFLGELYPFCDFFMHTWDGNTHAPTICEIPEIFTDIDEKDIDEIRALYKPIKFVVENFHEAFKTTAHMYPTIPFNGRFYSWEKSVNYKREYEELYNFKYDYVLKLRYDILFSPVTNLVNLIDGLKGNEFGVESTEEGKAISDFFFISDSKIMDVASKWDSVHHKEYKAIHNSYPDHVNEHELIIQYLKENDISINDFNSQEKQLATIYRPESVKFDPIFEYYKCWEVNHLTYWNGNYNTYLSYNELSQLIVDLTDNIHFKIDNIIKIVETYKPKSMRIAVCFGGLIRTGSFAEKNLKAYFGELLPYIDFFIHSWDREIPKPPNPDSSERNTYVWYSLNKLTDHTLKESKRDEFINCYRPISYMVDSLEDFNHNMLNLNNDEFLIYPPYWYSIYKSNQLKIKHEIKNNFKYDFVLRLRPDLLLNPGSTLMDDISILMKSDKKNVLLTTDINSEDQTLFLDDNIHLSTSLTMDIFCKIGNIFSPKYKHSYIREHLHLNDIQLKRIKTESYTILRDISTHLDPINDYLKIMKENNKYYSPSLDYNPNSRNKLFTFGCSFTAGDPIIYSNNEYVKKYKKSEDDMIWPELLAKEFDLDLINFGMGGYSNDMILDCIIENWDEIGCGDYVIIQETYTQRFDVLNPKTNSLITVNPNMVEHQLNNHPFNKIETSSISLTSVFMDSEQHRKRYDKRFKFLIKMLQDLKGIQYGIIWNVEDTIQNYVDLYESILTQTNGEIYDLHWSYNGHRKFSEVMINNITHNTCGVFNHHITKRRLI